MGYRELLKKYVRFLEVNVGDNYIEAVPDAAEPILSERDLGELRTIAAEIFREAHAAPDRARVENHNYRFRILLNRHGITIDQAATLAGVDAGTIRRWRTHPRSRRYLAMRAEDYAAFENALELFLADGGPLARGAGERDGLRSG
ncbi:MAG: hypothetical protein V2J24_15350 [Pseudomonadales bacterium]|jgi:hypothetical protein|nr:hypothetical protein [Pseudomonadales bacterium]